MKHLIFATTLLASVAAGAAPAFALSLSLDVPFQYSFENGGKADSVSGYKVGLGLPLFPVIGVGIGYENYEAKDSEGSLDSSVQFTFYDLFLEVPFPFVNVTVGAGWGKQTIKAEGDVLIGGAISSVNEEEEGNASQYFLSLGYPIFPLVDIHVGYHVIDAEKLDFNFGGIPAESDASGTMWSAGVRVGV